MKILTPLKAIRKHCLECSGDSFKHARECHLRDCPLWPYRMGHRPRKGENTPRSTPLIAPESRLDGGPDYALA